MTIQQVVKVDFTSRSNGSLLSAPTDGYYAVAVGIGSPEVRNNGFNAPAAGGHRAYFLEDSIGSPEEDEPRSNGNAYGEASTNYGRTYTQCVVKNHQNFCPGPIARANANGVGYMVVRTGLTTQRRLYQWTTGGSATTLVTVSSLPAMVTDDVLRVECDGTTIKGFLNGVEEISVVAAGVPWGSFGCYSLNDISDAHGTDLEAGHLDSKVPLNEGQDTDAAIISRRRHRNRGITIKSAR